MAKWEKALDADHLRRALAGGAHGNPDDGAFLDRQTEAAALSVVEQK